MFNSIVNDNKFNYNINAVSGTLRKSHPKSKIVIRTLSKDLWIFDKDKPRLYENTNEIVILQIMLVGDNKALIEYVLKKDFNEIKDEDNK